MHDTPFAIQAKGLSYRTSAGFTICENLDFDVRLGSLTSIKGPSGCGKTTLLRIIAGLARSQAGQLILHNELVDSPNVFIPPHRRGVGLLFQELALWPHMTGEAQLRFVWDAHPTTESYEQRKTFVVEQIGLPEYLLGRYPSELSRGQQQRLAIARAVIHKPRLLLLDEPLTALDQDLRQKLAAFITTLHSDPMITVVLVSHDLLPDLVLPDAEFILHEGSLKQIYRE